MSKTLPIILISIAVLLPFILVVVIVVYTIFYHTNGAIQTSMPNRKYLLHVPKSYNPANPISLVISLHGFIETPAHQMKVSHWNDLADEYGFIVVYPMGTGFPLRWGTPSWAGDGGQALRDVKFISDMIDKIEGEYNIDKTRIYANGLSNGGGMSFLLACKLSDRIAAIGGVAGAYSTPFDECNPSRPVPVIAFHGDADPIVPYQGGTRRPPGFSLPAVSDWIAGWAKHNRCNTPPVELPANGEVSGIRYTNCAQNADVDFYAVHGGGHSWPGGKGLPRLIVGHTTQDIDATQVMWDFFQAHPLHVNGN